MNAYKVTGEMTTAAREMLANDWDYWPHNFIGMPHNITLYNYADGVWLVDINETASMNDAVKLVKVL